MDDSIEYHNLTARGKLKRLRKLAGLALQNYPILQPVIQYHSSHTNVFFRVTARSGEKFILRLASPGWRSKQDLNSEVMWLQALGRDTDIPVPSIVPTRTGEFVLPYSMHGITETWHVTLMTWVPGRLLGRYLTVQNLEKMGELFARLHIHGAAFTPPAGFTTRRFEHWLSRGEENLIIAGEGTPSERQRQTLKTLTLEQRKALERVDRQVEMAYAALDRSDLRVIHCDLWHDNIKLHGGQLLPFDFEDTVWGFRAHDIAMSMLDLQDETNATVYPALFSAFQQGYTGLLPWPEDPIEPCQIGRLLWKINWVAGHEPQWLPNMVERYLPVFENFEKTGKVVLPRG